MADDGHTYSPSELDGNSAPDQAPRGLLVDGLAFGYELVALREPLQDRAISLREGAILLWMPKGAVTESVKLRGYRR